MAVGFGRCRPKLIRLCHPRKQLFFVWSDLAKAGIESPRDIGRSVRQAAVEYHGISTLATIQSVRQSLRAELAQIRRL